MSYKNLIDRTELQRLQDEFCSVTNVLAYCINTEGEKVTELSGAGEAKETVLKSIPAEEILSVLDRVEEGSLEDMAVEKMGNSQGYVAAIAVRVKDTTVCYWVIISLDEKTEEPQFYRTLDFIRDTSYMMLANKMSCVSAEAQIQRIREATQEMSTDLHALEATTAIVQLLDSDEPMEGIVDKWLRIIGEHLQVDTAQMLSLHRHDELMDVICEWTKQGQVSFFDRTSNVKTYKFLQGLKPLVISGDSAPNEYQKELEAVGVKAVMVFPVTDREDGRRWVLSLNHRERFCAWSMEEIKFVSDAVKLMQSILTRQIQQDSLFNSHAALKAVLDNVGCSVYVMDKDTREMLFANKKLQNTFAKELREGTLQRVLSNSLTEGRENGKTEVCFGDEDDWYDLVYREIVWVDGRQTVLFSLYEITDKKKYQKKIEQQAHTDFLTGLYNRMCFERDLAKHIDDAKRNKETGAVLYLDLDDFKHINDGLGHQYGDILLKAIARGLQNVECIHDTCYRMGGDEFVILIPPCYYTEFDRIVEDIREVFRRPFYLKDEDYYCTTSMGSVTFPDFGDSVADLIKKADIAMYEAKKSGKNKIASYKEGVDTESGKRLDMEKNMRDAIADGFKEFEVYYQPIINVENGQKLCAGAEALIRWNSAKLGMIPPAEFIPLAEYLGLINPLGEFVLRQACAHCKKWNNSGYPDYKVNVNLSVVQLLQNDIVDIVADALKESGLNPKNLCLEVTESLAINDTERMKSILAGIKELGVKIALDDFGTGYSSLNHIREFPFDIIKVDQSFVKELAEDSYSQSFIKMIAELGESIDVNICVEGIETRAQYETLHDMKVKYIQGYYFDRPLRSGQFEEKYMW